MRKEIGVDDDAIHFEVISLDTGEVIPYCVWADDETGEYCVFEREDDDFVLEWSRDEFKSIPVPKDINLRKMLINKLGEYDVRRVIKKGNIKLHDTREEAL